MLFPHVELSSVLVLRNSEEHFWVDSRDAIAPKKGTMNKK